MEQGRFRSHLKFRGLLAVMPKQKTHKGMKKRFKITASGKARHRSAFRGHKLSSKAAKRKRALRKDGLVTGNQAETIVDALRPCM